MTACFISWSLARKPRGRTSGDRNGVVGDAVVVAETFLRVLTEAEGADLVLDGDVEAGVGDDLGEDAAAGAEGHRVRASDDPEQGRVGVTKDLALDIDVEELRVEAPGVERERLLAGFFGIRIRPS